MKRMITLLMLVCAGCMSDALAESPGSGGDYGFVEGGGAVGGASDIELNVGSKLIFDADTDSNNYFYSVADTLVDLYVEGTQIFQTSNAQFGFKAVDVKLNSGQDLIWGSDNYYWATRNFAGSQFELWSTNVDTFGADGLVFSVDDGTDDVDFSGSLGLSLTQKIYFDSDEDSDTYIDGETADRIRFISAGTARARFDPNNGFLIYDGQRISFGTGADQYLTYTDGTGVTWNDGTNTVLTVPDDSNEVRLPVGAKLIFDGDDDANTYFTHLDASNFQLTVAGQLVYNQNSVYTRWSNNKGLGFGNSTNYWQIYNSAGQFEFWSTNVDTFGADGLVFSVDDGTDDVDFSGDITVPTSAKIYLDGGTDDYFTSPSTGQVSVVTAGQTRVYFNTSGIVLNDSRSIQFGSGADQLLTYTDGTGVTWNDGTNTVLTVPDDTNAFNLGTGTNLGFGNAEFIHNDTDGIITLGGSGGTHNEALTILTDYGANNIRLSSTTGATTLSTTMGVDIDGDLTVDGNQTYYGGMYNETTRTVTVSATDTPYQIVGPDPYWFTAMPTNGVSLANDELTVTNAGTYLITAGVSAKLAAGGATRLVKGYIYLDDGTPAAIAGCSMSRALNSSQDVGRGAISCIATLAASDKLELWIENAGGAGTEDIEIEYASLTVQKL